MAEPAPETDVLTDGSSDEHRRLTDALQQAVATQDILAALGRAGANPAGVLDVIVARVLSLCRADASQLYLLDDGVFRLSRVSGELSEEFRRYLHEHPISRDRSTLIGRVAEDRLTQQIPDVLDDPQYGRPDLQRLGGYRTLMSAPMLLDDEVVGVLSVWRTDVAPFDVAEQGLLSSFAVQAAIVLRQVELRRALEERTEELAANVAALEALREVGQAVSSSLDLDEVLEQVVRSAVHLTGTDGGSIMEHDPVTQTFSVRSAYGGSEGFVDRLRSVRISERETLVGRTALEHRTLELTDLSAVEPDPHLQLLREDGWRSLLAVPLLRQDRMLGALVIRRRSPGHFPGDTVELLRTFASQSALAIANARLFRELETSRRELEEASRHKSEFLASMSHELRTPLNAVIGFSEVLLDRMFGPLNERQEEYLHDIASSGRHLLELLNEILDLSKVEAGQMVLQPSVFSVPTALEYALSMVRERAAAHGIGLELSVAPEVGFLEADELRFRQVLLNLLSNAVKFTPDGGSVSVSADVRDGELVVAVSDTGIGVAPEDRERIFESFQQGPRGAPKEEGTGLGLTLSRRIIELFSGRIWLESEPGVGSTFTFAVPLTTAGAPADSPASGDHPLVLLVDDDRASLDLFTAYLAGAPARVARARDGTEALELVLRLRPSVVVLDLILPERDGWEVLAELRSEPETAATPVVIASIADERSRGLAAGAQEYLTKPVGRDVLLAALARVGVLPVATASALSAESP